VAARSSGAAAALTIGIVITVPASKAKRVIRIGHVLHLRGQRNSLAKPFISEAERAIMTIIRYQVAA
jgi:hypothetical protein